MTHAFRQSSDLTNYKPEKGLKSIAVAEAAEKHFRRAKDATHLLEAIELKLGEQRKFVLWWDGQDKPKGGRGKTHNRPVNGLPDAMTIARWRARLKDEPRFQATLAKAQARAVKLVEFQQGGAYTKSEHNEIEEWYTPPEYVEAARDVLGAIDLDPATSELAQRTVKATRYFTAADDGLAHEWPGRVFLNPPYTQPEIAHFVGKLVEEVEAKRTSAAILLTHNYTDTAWFHRGVSACAAICFTRGRVAFVGADGSVASPTQGQAFFYYGPESARFAARFAEIGFIVQPR